MAAGELLNSKRRAGFCQRLAAPKLLGNGAFLMTASLRNQWQHACGLALDAVFPPRCIACRAWSHEAFCVSCRQSLQPIRAPFCVRCGLPFEPLSLALTCADCQNNRHHSAPPFDFMRSVFRFEGPIRRAVHRFKYQGKWALGAPLANEICALLRNQDATLPRIPIERIALVVPVPLHGWRKFRRGYNQSALLAQEIATHFQKVRPNNGCPPKEGRILFKNALKRVRYTPPQVELGRQARGENVRGAFALRENPSGRGAILLIDDVCTTGATIRECARVLKSAGAPEVYALTLARQV